MGEGEGKMIWENGIKTCIISYMKRVTSPGSMHNTGCLGLVHWDDPEGWYGEGGGFRMGNTCIPWRIHVDTWQNQYNIVKLKNIYILLQSHFLMTYGIKVETIYQDNIRETSPKSHQ